MIRNVPSLTNVEYLVEKHSIDDIAIQSKSPDQIIDLLTRLEYVERAGANPLVVKQYLGYKKELDTIWFRIGFTGMVLDLDELEQSYLDKVDQFLTTSHEVTVMLAESISTIGNEQVEPSTEVA